MVGAGHPQGQPAAHAPPAGEDVHLRLVEHVAHVQTAGDVGRRQQDGERGLAVQALVLDGAVPVVGRRNGEKVLADPVTGPVIFNGGWVVGFGQIVRHFVFGEPLEICGNSHENRGFQSEGTTFQVSRWRAWQFAR